MQLLPWNALSLPAISFAFGASALAVGVAGTAMTSTADRLADLTGLGEAIFGAVLLGSATSIAGITTSVTAAIDGRAPLAISNAIGGIAAQTVFLAIADIAYRPANLEHAAASVENLLQGALLSTILSIPLLGMAGPRMDLLGIHLSEHSQRLFVGGIGKPSLESEALFSWPKRFSPVLHSIRNSFGDLVVTNYYE